MTQSIDIGAIITDVQVAIKFFNDHPDALAEIQATVNLIKSIIAAFQAANPPAPSA